MQPLPGRTSNSLSKQTRRIATYAILLFAAAGLISGFAVGAFVHSKGGATGPTTSAGSSPIAHQTKTATPTAQPSPGPVRIPDPTIDGFGPDEVSNGTTYTLTAHLNNVLGPDGQPVHANGLTCKLWLIQGVPDNQKVSIAPEILKSVATINQPFTSQANDKNGKPVPGASFPEIQQGLVFDGATSQTQSCRTDGEGTWRYQVSPSVTPGKYTLVVLYDWSGIHFNWSWVDIKIKQAG
jgi:hypothetical protein